MIFLVLLTFLLYLFYICFYKPMQYWKNLKVPFVKPIPILGNNSQLIFQRKNWAEWVSNLYYSHDNTRYIGIYQFTKPGLMIKDLELIKTICIKDFEYFSAKAQLVPENVEPIFSRNLLSIRGQRWKQMRATLSPTFTGNKMRSMFILMKQCSEQFISHLKERVKPNETYETEMKDLFARFANDVIASTAFGIPCDSIADEKNDFYILAKKATSFVGFSLMFKIMGYLYFSPIMRFFNLKIFNDDMCNYFKNIVVNNIKQREEKNIIRPDMIHLLMQARKGKLKYETSGKNDADDTGFATVEESHIGKNIELAKFDLTDDDILAQAFIFFLAGFDGVSTIMSHMTYELAIHKDIQLKLQDEIDATLQDCNDGITYEKLMKMKYLDMVFCETLRKWPGAPIVDRECTSSYTITSENPNEPNVTLSTGDLIYIPIFAIHRDPKYFPNPEKFDPERFNEENKHKIIPLSYLPFGVGPRNCIGSRFGIMEIKLIMFYILSQFNIVLTKKSEVPLILTTKTISINPRNGFWLGLQLRKNKTC